MAGVGKIFPVFLSSVAMFATTCSWLDTVVVLPSKNVVRYVKVVKQVFVTNWSE